MQSETVRQSVPIIELATAPGERAAWDKPKLVVYLWAAAELLFVTNPWQVTAQLSWGVRASTSSRASSSATSR